MEYAPEENYYDENGPENELFLFFNGIPFNQPDFVFNTHFAEWFPVNHFQETMESLFCLLIDILMDGRKTRTDKFRINTVVKTGY